MKVVGLVGDGTWHRGLIHRIAGTPGVELSGVLAESRPRRTSLRGLTAQLARAPGSLIDRGLQRLFYGGVLESVREEAIARFGRNGTARPWPDVPVRGVSDVNADATVQALREWRPEVIVVSGTRLIRERVLAEAPDLAFLNLHTGISPFYKGGPNCTLWCLANREPEFIGSTIHVIDPGIDSGDLVVTGRPSIERDDTVATLVCKAVETGHDLYLRVLRTLASGATLRPLDQEALGPGRTYYSREWNVRMLSRAVGFVRSGRLRDWVHAGRPGHDEVRLVDVLRDGS